MTETKSVLAEIAAERDRQINVKGWTPEHDDVYRFDELSTAAACYAVEGTNATVLEASRDAFPWADNYDSRKRHSRRERLIIAAALIVAEIEREDRAALPSPREG